ncbi:MAG: hypothetical protein E5X67_15030 [Mesorhizobium sp.]|uniref:hypothetical protein n=1 Tax=Mesorhizobium sp. TaxID=1871066 RepID=UPI0011FF1467|nr:hypothetical protein [Mesorhizobium sp.]TIP27633.1 MAG: hypothetical protein E5X67_15030 [Mesorhizobium sp.]
MKRFEALAHSLVIDPPLSESEIAELRLSTDPWRALAYLVHRASTGDFAVVSRIEGLMRSHDSALFWSAATTFAGVAGPWRSVRAIAESFRAERHRYGVQYYISNMLMYSCNPVYAELLLELYEAGEDDDIRDHIARNLSLLLESDIGPVFLGAPESDKYPLEEDADSSDAADYAGLGYVELFAKVHDFEGYRRTVLQAREAIQAAGLQPGSAVFEGEILDAQRLATKYAKQTAADTVMANKVFEGLRLLSAMVGLNCRGIVSDSGSLSPLGASALVEDLIDSPLISRMAPGQRYFFGHPIPT